MSIFVFWWGSRGRVGKGGGCASPAAAVCRHCRSPPPPAMAGQWQGTMKQETFFKTQAVLPAKRDARGRCKRCKHTCTCSRCWRATLARRAGFRACAAPRRVQLPLRRATRPVLLARAMLAVRCAENRDRWCARGGSLEIFAKVFAGASAG